VDINGCDIQVEHGKFAQVHNLILDTLAVARFTASEFRVILFLLRKTYGFGKKEDDLSLKQWATGTDTDKTQVSRTLADLVEKNVIYRSESPRPFCHRYGFNKYIENWSPSIFGRIEARKTRNLDPVVNKNVDPVVNESENLDPVVKEILTTGSNNKRKITKEINTTSRAHRKPTPKPQVDSVSQEWFGALCWLVNGHKDYGLLSNEEKIAIGKTAKAIRESKASYTLDDLRAWYRDIWAKEWPGKQRDSTAIQPPTLKQIKTGIGRVKPDLQNEFSAVTTSPSVIDISVGEYL